MEFRQVLTIISALAAILGIPVISAGYDALGFLLLIGGILGFAVARIIKDVS